MSRDRLEREDAEGKARTPSWCIYTKTLLFELGLGKFWSLQRTFDPDCVDLVPRWRDRVRTSIHAREQTLWRNSCLDRPKLRTYVTLKVQLLPEPWLVLPMRGGGLSELVKLRGGSSRLRIEKGRFSQEALEDRVCVFCDSGLVEDEAHFMVACPVYDDLRSTLWASLESLIGYSRDPSLGSQLQALLGNTLHKLGNKKFLPCLRKILQFIQKAMHRRADLERREQKFGEKKKEK